MPSTSGTVAAMTSTGPALARTVATATPDTRNRSVDFFRAVSMAVVAIGHWLGMVMVRDGDGELVLAAPSTSSRHCGGSPGSAR